MGQFNVLRKIKQEGFFWFEGGPTDVGSSRKRLHLRVSAGNEAAALKIARIVIETAGAEASNLTVV